MIKLPMLLVAFCFTFSFFAYNIGQACDDIKVLRPFYPYYVQEGSNLTLQCQCPEGNIQLEWVKQTPGTNWNDEKIIPSEFNDFFIRTLTEEPTGFVESTLIKKNVDVDDRGTYLCRDQAKVNSFGVWVTILKVNAQDVHPVGTEETVELTCQVTGFVTNPSSMLYIWQRNGKAFQLTHMDKEMAFGDKYIGRVTFLTSTSFTIVKPDKSDAGKYTCSFVIASDIGPQVFSETVHVYGTNLQAKASLASASISTVLLVVILQILAS